MSTEWTELMFLQIRAGNTALFVFALAVLCVFLALAASTKAGPCRSRSFWWCRCACSARWPACCSRNDDSVNIFVQIGLVVLVGLACKNAILVVEFAQQLHQGGKSRAEAARGGVAAAAAADHDDLVRLHSRRRAAGPGLGAGAEMRRSLGTAVFSGMLGVTLFGVFLTPVFFYFIQRFLPKPPD